MTTFIIVLICTICGFMVGAKAGFKVGVQWSIDEIDKTFKVVAKK